MVGDGFVRLYCESVIAALTPAQRYEALRNLQSPNPLTDRRFIIGGLIAIAILLALLAIVHYWQKIARLRTARSWFANFVARHELETSEQKLLKHICKRAGTNQIDAVFTMPDIFDKGANHLLAEKMLQGHTSFEKFQSSVVVLRAKMGYDVQNLAAQNDTALFTIKNSRQIPANKTIRLTRRKNGASTLLEAIITSNTEEGLSVRMPVNFEQSAAGAWILQYDSGPMVLEFKAHVIKNVPGELTFAHTDEIRFASRRRFMRVPYRSKAQIALYQFISEDDLAVPKFEPAMLTQLAGPGLLLESDIEVKVGQRVLVIFGLPQGKTIQDIALVRHVRKIEKENGYSIAVEVIGAKEADFDLLVQATMMVAKAEDVAENEIAVTQGR